MRLPALAITSLMLGTGCAHRGIRFPGPTKGMGEDPQAYADTLEGEDGEEQELARVDRRERPVRGAPEQRRPRRGGAGEEVARAAGNLVGKDRLMADGEEYRNDCSGLVLC